MREPNSRRATLHRQRLEALLHGSDAAADTYQDPRSAPPTSEEAPSSLLPALERPVFQSVSPSPRGRRANAFSGIKLAIFVGLGVAVGGLVALQLDRAFRAHEAEPDIGIGIARMNASVEPPLEPAALPQRSAIAQECDAPRLLRGDVTSTAAGPYRTSTHPVSIAHSVPLFDRTTTVPPTVTREHPSAADGQQLTSSDDNRTPTESACLKTTGVQIPTQLHPRVNALMTSSQVFTDR